MKECRYDNSRVAWEDEKGRHNYSRCSICGKWHKGYKGLIIDYNGFGRITMMREKLCQGCAVKAGKMLEPFIEWVFEQESKMEKDVSDIGRECDRRIRYVLKMSEEENDEQPS